VATFKEFVFKVGGLRDEHRGGSMKEQAGTDVLSQEKEAGADAVPETDFEGAAAAATLAASFLAAAGGVGGGVGGGATTFVAAMGDEGDENDSSNVPSPPNSDQFEEEEERRQQSPAATHATIANIDEGIGKGMLQEHYTNETQTHTSSNSPSPVNKRTREEMEDANTASSLEPPKSSMRTEY
jgi:hypothetical protein